MEELIKEFIDTKICQFCGSQRCDCSEEWIQGCPEFKKFIKNKFKELKGNKND